MSFFSQDLMIAALADVDLDLLALPELLRQQHQLPEEDAEIVFRELSLSPDGAQESASASASSPSVSESGSSSSHSFSFPAASGRSKGGVKKTKAKKPNPGTRRLSGKARPASALSAADSDGSHEGGGNVSPNARYCQKARIGKKANTSLVKQECDRLENLISAHADVDGHALALPAEAKLVRLQCKERVLDCADAVATALFSSPAAIAEENALGGNVMYSRRSRRKKNLAELRTLLELAMLEQLVSLPAALLVAVDQVLDSMGANDVWTSVLCHATGGWRRDYPTTLAERVGESPECAVLASLQLAVNEPHLVSVWALVVESAALGDEAVPMVAGPAQQDDTDLSVPLQPLPDLGSASLQYDPLDQLFNEMFFPGLVLQGNAWPGDHPSLDQDPAARGG